MLTEFEHKKGSKEGKLFKPHHGLATQIEHPNKETLVKCILIMNRYRDRWVKKGCWINKLMGNF